MPDLIEAAIRIASTAPSGAHKQPRRFVATSAPAVKRAIRAAAEEEERVNYLENRMNDEWQEAPPSAPTTTRSFSRSRLIVVFEERYEVRSDGEQRKNYVKESCGIAGLFVAALHNMGLATLTHTPSPMAFLTAPWGDPRTSGPLSCSRSVTRFRG